MSLVHESAAPHPGDDVVGWTAVGVIGVGGIAAFCQRALDVGPRNCVMRSAFGIPCPVCGLSTVAVRGLRLDVLGALRLDPIGVTLLAVIGVVATLQLVRSFSRRAPLIPWRWTLGVPVVLMLAHWALTLDGVVTLSPLR